MYLKVWKDTNMYMTHIRKYVKYPVRTVSTGYNIWRMKYISVSVPFFKNTLVEV